MGKGEIEMTPETTVILGLLAEDKEVISYRKQLNNITHSVLSTILLQQMIFRAKQKDWQPFYKFRAPCKHKLYKPGDSWTEELGFSGAEFDTALKRIGTKVTKGIKKSKVFEDVSINSLIIYWTDASRVTWYQLNVELLGNLTKSNYLVKQESGITLESINDELPLAETPTETPTESIPTPDFLGDIFNQQGKVSEVTGPNPEDQWFEYSSRFLKTFQEKMGRYPNTDEKAAISEIADMEGADLGRWEKALAECNLNYTGHKCPVSRAIEVYQSGGTWADWQRWRGKQDEGPIKPKNEREKMLDPITGEWTGGYYS